MNNVATDTTTTDDGSPHAGTPGWWRRNRLPLAALVVLTMLTPVVYAGNSLRQRRDQTASDPIVVDVGQTANYGAATVGPATAMFGTDDDAPADTRVIVATIAMSDASSLDCFDPRLVETGGAQRTFTSTTRLRSDDEFRAPTNCLLGGGDAYELSLTYIVPRDAAGPFVITLESTTELPRYVEFKVQP